MSPNERGLAEMIELNWSKVNWFDEVGLRNKPISPGLKRCTEDNWIEASWSRLELVEVVVSQL